MTGSNTGEQGVPFRMFFQCVCKKLKMLFEELVLMAEICHKKCMFLGLSASDGASFVSGGGGLRTRALARVAALRRPRKALRHKFETCFVSLLHFLRLLLPLLDCYRRA